MMSRRLHIFHGLRKCKEGATTPSIEGIKSMATTTTTTTPQDGAIRIKGPVKILLLMMTTAFIYCRYYHVVLPCPNISFVFFSHFSRHVAFPFFLPSRLTALKRPFTFPPFYFLSSSFEPIRVPFSSMGGPFPLISKKDHLLPSSMRGGEGKNSSNCFSTQDGIKRGGGGGALW